MVTTVLIRAFRETEGSDLRLPAALRTGQVVLVCVPEGAIIHWVHGHAAERAPVFVRAILRSSSGDHVDFRLHYTGMVSNRVSGVTDAGEHRRAGYVVSDGDIAKLVFCDAAEPAPSHVGSNGARLENDRSQRSAVFIPADSRMSCCAGASRDGVSHHNRLVGAEVAVGDATVQTISPALQQVRCAGLWDARLEVVAGVSVGRKYVGNGTGEGGVHLIDPVHVELERVQIVLALVGPLIELPEESRFTSGWQGLSVESGDDERRQTDAALEADREGKVSSEHSAALKGAGL